MPRKVDVTGRTITILLAAAMLASSCRQSEKVPAQDAMTHAEKARQAQYVGDEACASCHNDMYTSYHRTGMGRSLTRFDPETAPEQFGEEEAVYHTSSDLYYEAVTRGDTLYQREFRLNDKGDTTYQRMERADWVIGSGNATRSYLTRVNGYVSEMPLTWYVERRKWDMSPGYKQKNQRFDRPVNEACMTCHNGYVDFSQFSQSHFDLQDMPLGITCERCHGPGSEHVKQHLAGLGPTEGEEDTTIVNPADLERDLQLDVCQQCHLTGLTVLKPGDSLQGFRPGKPLSAQRAVFVPRRELEDPKRFGIASHALRLEKSACFKHSDMTCTTCHDPHQPVAEQGPNHFNEVCQSCHEPSTEQPVCSRPEAHKAEVAMTGDCAGCHMQKGGTSDIPHVTFTDHWIRRDPPENAPPSERAGQGVIEAVGQKTLDLVRVTEDKAKSGSGQDSLERAIAYFKLYETKHRQADYLPRITRLVRRGKQRGAVSAEGQLALGRALLSQDSLQAAARVLKKAVHRYPDHGRLRYWLGETQRRRGNTKRAVKALKKAWSIQPAFVEAGLKLGRALSEAERTKAAIRVYKEVLRRDPKHHPQAWNNLGFIYLKKRKLGEALNHFQRALALRPDFAQALVNAGTVHLLRKEMGEAQRYFERSIDTNPDYTPAYGNLAMIYARSGERKQARKLLRKLLARNPGDRRARSLLKRLRRTESSTDAKAPNT